MRRQLPQRQVTRRKLATRPVNNHPHPIARKDRVYIASSPDWLGTVIADGPEVCEVRWDIYLDSRLMRPLTENVPRHYLRRVREEDE